MALLGSVRLLGVVHSDGSYLGCPELTPELAAAARASEWWLGPIGWVLADPIALDTPIPIPGKLGLWHVPHEHIDALTRMR